MAKLQCFNKGCGSKFDPLNNDSESCTFHPGGPVFHDALKGWSCCKKRSTDFTEFLNIPGCTKGLHSNVKPIEPEKTTNEVVVIEDVKPEKTVQNKPLEKPMERPSSDETMVTLKTTTGASLKQVLDKQMKAMTLTAEDSQEKDPNSVSVGTSCKNNACKECYKGEESNLETCLFHPGVPIFHEGMKYWSCCQHKTSEFENFLAQEGCQQGSHVWIKKDNEKQKTVCRYDWHQTGGFVVISVFAKCTLPESTKVEANKVSLKIDITYEGGLKNFSELMILNGVIDPLKSHVKLLGTKVEISLKKFEPGSWPRLEYKQ